MHYIYRHIRLDTNTPFYIGKGKGKRAYSKQGRNQYWHNIVNSIGYKVEILWTDLSELEAYEKECLAIKSNKLFGLAEANLALGGIKGGPSGILRSSDTRKKIAQAKMGDKNPMKNPETVEKMRQSKLGKPTWAATNAATKANSIEVYDVVTGKNWPCIQDASYELGYSRSYLAKMLSGACRNTTSIRKVG